MLREKRILNSNWGWTLFNITFICFYQHALLLLITAPCAWAATTYAQKIPLNEYDLYATLLFLFFFNLERVADNQQWRFQQAKHGKAKREAKYETDYQNGFLSKGLFARSRHPNFFSEQMIWWSLCVFVLAVLLDVFGSFGLPGVPGAPGVPGVPGAFGVVGLSSVVDCFWHPRCVAFLWFPVSHCVRCFIYHPLFVFVCFRCP